VTPTDAPARSAGDHRRERTLDDRRHPDHVEPALPGERQVVDVEDRELGAAGLEQLRRVGRRGRLADGQIDAAVGERAVGERRVDASVHGVGLEVEDEGRLVRGARFSTVPATGREADDGEDGRQRRGDPSHCGAQDTVARWRS
jgi:hypothetical protein